MHSYSVQLRVYGPTLEPERITQVLSLSPNLVRLKGTARGRHGIWEESLWSYSGAQDETPREWDNLEDGLSALMLELWQKKDLISSLTDQFDVVWWCGHFQSSLDGGPTMSVELMRKLAEFGVPLYLDNYFSEAERSG